MTRSDQALADAGPAAERARLVAATAANLAGWHELNLRALGHRTAWRDGWWLTPDEVPGIFFRAIAIRPGAVPHALGDLAAGGCAVCDPWAEQDLGNLGMTIEADHPWMVRPPGRPPAVPQPDDLGIERVAEVPDLVAFEAAAAQGFGMPVPPAYTWHAPPLLDDPRFDLWLGRRPDGRTIATANGFREAGALGIYSVSTVPLARRHGVGAAMTARAIAGAPELPAILQPSVMAEPLYRRLGFDRFTTFRTWTRSAP